MCGICGFVGRGDRQDLARMTAVMTHRGPDAEGLWHDEEAAAYLGHRRLSIIDIAGGSQPMWTSDGALGVAFNGEIYNHVELRATLTNAGHRFSSDHSDTEVLLHGYREWGAALPQRLNGMWAFAIYDRKKRELFISRDRFGKKPLFYSLQNGTFVFSSELSSLVKHPSVVARINPMSLKKYFAYGYIPAPWSLYQNIFKLPGGYNLCLSLSTMEMKITKYWDLVLEPFDRIPANPEGEWGEAIRDLLRKAVRRRLMSDVPLGIFLSGGIDSSAIAALAVASAGDRIKSFSIGFEEASFDESGYSRQVASLLGTDHVLEFLSLEKSIGLLDDIAGRLDEPMGDSSMLPTYLLCRETRKQVTVALGGDGGDELFAGYDPFKALYWAELYNKLIPKPIHAAIRMAMALLPTSHRNMSLDFRIKRTLRGLSYPRRFWNAVWLGPLEPTDLAELFREPVDLEEIYAEAIEHWENCPQDTIADKTLQFYAKLYLQDDILVKVDRASMMHSLEVRAPFLDIELVDFVRRIPSAYKCRQGQTKYILKKALEPVLPAEILYRSKKGFGVPIGKWFQAGSLVFDGTDSTGLMNAGFMARMADEHRMNRHDHRAFLWNAWLLSQWNRVQ
jgi:asparagine synthase (glutamine-hydrolysing)